MGIFKKLQEIAEKGKQEIEEKTSDKLMEEELNSELRKHHGEPIRKPKPKEK